MYTLHTTCQVPLAPPCSLLRFPSFERRPAYPCAALSGIPALECARAAKGCRPRTAPRALLPKLRLDGAGFHPALGPGKRGFLKECSFPLSRPIQYISPQLARAIVQRTFKAMLITLLLLLASLLCKNLGEGGGALRAGARPKGGAPSACACACDVENNKKP